ncbi:hypothetical protein Baya_8825 [Bagarius yarrelli]|uniref:Uncharacterized protein n=1 Tax=Bagarius yarrelli TaxID=175774 RepID=A0A556UAG2_BAGYA|nr:hypothetical protein Baya_8825 [Bagarius yarrelli]
MSVHCYNHGKKAAQSQQIKPSTGGLLQMTQCLRNVCQKRPQHAAAPRRGEALLAFPAKSLLERSLIKVTGGLPCIRTSQSIYTTRATGVGGRHKGGLWEVNRAVSYRLHGLSGIINYNFAGRTWTCQRGSCRFKHKPYLFLHPDISQQSADLPVLKAGEGAEVRHARRAKAAKGQHLLLALELHA